MSYEQIHKSPRRSGGFVLNAFPEGELLDLEEDDDEGEE